MKNPGTTDCDLCRNEIPRGIRHATVSVPLAKGDKALVAEEMRKHGPKPPAHSIFGAMVDPNAMVPEFWQFEVCMGCVDGLMPMLRDLKTKQITHILNDRATVRARAEMQDDAEAQP
jgi:hypothetical protein